MQAERRTVTYTRHEWVLPSPCAVGELHKALNSAYGLLPEDRCPYDDALTIEARDDEIVVWWEDCSPETHGDE